MAKEKVAPIREHKLQAIVDYLVDNGVSDFQVNILIHTNMPALNLKNIVDCVREDRWDDAWSAAELYISGDMW